MRDERSAEGSSYIDAMARASPTEVCIRCSSGRPWKTASLVHQASEWDYYYCYQCRHWFSRHYRYRYAVAPVDFGVARALTRQLELQQRDFDSALRSSSWLRRLIGRASSVFRKNHS
jgi:hypothetical protein